MFKVHPAPSTARRAVVGSVLSLVILFTSAGFSLPAKSEADNSTVDVHISTSKQFVGRVAATNDRVRIKTQGSWDIVTFTKPTVPLWVSADYIDRAGSTATVRVNNLNGRVQPSLNSVVVKQLPKGYASVVLAERNGFVQILAPRDWQFAVSNRQSKQRSLARASTSVIENERTIPVVESSNPPIKKSVAPAEPPSTELHVIAPGDTISMLVFGEPDLSASAVRVPASGLVSFPLIGSTLVAGKTTEEIESMVAIKLGSGYIKNPKLSVTIDSYRPIFIRGAVQSTGSFPYTEGLTVAKALALAGGIKNSAKSDSISVLRDGGTIQSNLSVDSQYQINSGDIISIEEELGVGEELNFYIYLHGEVKKPGEYIFKRGLTVEKAVVLAGGFTLRASKRKISVSRMVEGQEEPEELRRVKLYIRVQPGDIVNVGASWF